MDAGADRRAPGARFDLQRRKVRRASRLRPDGAAAADAGREDREAVRLRLALVSAGPEGAGAYGPSTIHAARCGGATFPGWRGCVEPPRARAAAAPSRGPVRQAS